MIIHVAGASGAGKTTLGNKLKEKFKNKIEVKDIDDLREDFIKKYYGKGKVTPLKTFNKYEYQKYIDNFVKKHKSKPIIFVGLNHMPWWHKNHYYNMHSEYNYFIDLDDETILKQKCWRFFNRVATYHLDYMVENNTKFIKYVSSDMLEECGKKKILSANNKWRKDYDKQNYKFMSRTSIYNKIVRLLK